MSAPSTTPRVGPLPLAEDDQPPPGRYCDLVMKGGVTDGVVYPWAILELARQYRFQTSPDCCERVQPPLWLTQRF
ncbi:MAG: hypothetical protein NTY26_02570 [Burkholderiales bacterium]|nr:hypothetical protein [Burkholderiales bacterium]